MNVFNFSGNLGRDAELRKTQNGTAVLSFSVPVKAGYGERETVTWVDCAMFGKRAEGRLVEYLKKGTPVCVSGEARLDTYPKNDGTQGAKISVNVNDVTMMGRAQGGSDGGNSGDGGGGQASGGGGTPDWDAPSGGGNAGGYGGGADLDDDIPF